MARYDEDLHENLFFQTLVGKYGAIFKEAADKRWMVRMPKGLGSVMSALYKYRPPTLFHGIFTNL